jgi:cysteinyl-tRNA synthetase
LITAYAKQFEEAINDDLNMPVARSIMLELATDERVGAASKYSLLLRMDEVLGLGINEMEDVAVTIPQDIQQLIAKRDEARKRKDWALADLIREEITRQGYSIIDTPEGQKIEKQKNEIPE